MTIQERSSNGRGRANSNNSVAQRLRVGGPKEEATIPTAANEAILITGVIEAKQQRDIMTLPTAIAVKKRQLRKEQSPNTAAATADDDSKQYLVFTLMVSFLSVGDLPTLAALNKSACQVAQISYKYRLMKMNWSLFLTDIFFLIRDRIDLRS